MSAVDQAAARFSDALNKKLDDRPTRDEVRQIVREELAAALAEADQPPEEA